MTGDNMGGSHIALMLLLKYLPDKFQTLVLLDQNGQFAFELEKNHIPFYSESYLENIKKEKRRLRRIKQFFKIQWKLRKFLKEKKIDLIHVSDGDLPSVFLVSGLINRIPVIWHHHNHLTYSKCDRLSVFFSYNNIFVSEYLKSLTPSIKGRVIYNPIESSESTLEKSIYLTNQKIPTYGPSFFSIPLAPLAKSMHNVEEELKTQLTLKSIKPLVSARLDTKDHILIGFIANLYHRKRPFLMLEALNIVHQEGVSFNCFFYGDEREISFQELINLSRHYKIEKKIKICKFSINIQSIFPLLDIVVCPAVQEPFGRVLIEAMSHKVPVIASEHGGHKEIILHKINGLLFEPDNAKDLALNIKRLTNDSELRSKLAENAYKKTMADYNIKNHIFQITKFYEEILRDL